jgi:hypothetical protein
MVEDDLETRVKKRGGGKVTWSYDVPCNFSLGRIPISPSLAELRLK